MQKDKAFRLFVGSGFTLSSVEPKPNYHLFKVERTELLGTIAKYHVAISGAAFAKADVEALGKGARRDGAALVLVGDCWEETGAVPLLTAEQFADRLGGPVLSLLPLDKEYPARLKDLGKNIRPPGLQGDPSELFEEYTHAGLQFLFRSRVIRYGQDRRFEKFADGIAIGDSATLLLYDAKAYGKGYPVSAGVGARWKSNRKACAWSAGSVSGGAKMSPLTGPASTEEGHVMRVGRYRGTVFSLVGTPPPRHPFKLACDVLWH